jgi:amino acid adenylation domain-containing protein
LFLEKNVLLWYNNCQGERFMDKLTHPQMRIMINQKIYQHSKFAYMYGLVEIHDQSADSIERAINEAINYFDALRTRFTQKKGEIFQYFEPYIYEKIPIKDQNDDFSKEVFELFDSKLYRFFLIQNESEVKGYYFIFHHAIVDAYSVILITKYIEDILLKKEINYNQTTYRNFIDLENRYLKSSIYEQDRLFFNDLLKIVTSFNYLPNFDLRTKRVELAFSEEESKSILSYCKSQKTSIFKFLMSITFLHLFLKTGKTIQTIATTHHNRLDEELLKTAGMMVGTVPVVQEIDLEKTFRDYLQESINNISASLERPLFPLDNIISEFNKSSTFDLNVTEVLFNSIPFSNNHYPIRRFSPNEDIAKLNFKLNPHSKPKGSNLEIAVDYRVSDYSESKAREILNEIKQLAFLFINHQDEKMESFLKKPLDIIDMIDFSHLNQTAIKGSNISFTYQELDYYSNALADEIEKLNHQVIGIANQRNPWYVVGLLGILKAGKIALPLDLTLPQQRLQSIMKDAKLKCIIGYDDIDISDLKVINITKLKPLTTYKKKTNEIAYIIFSSGTTGVPKGVLVSRSSLTSFIGNLKQKYYNVINERFLAYCDFNFDVSMLEIMISLVTQSTLYLTNEEERHNLSLLANVIRDYQINHVFFPTKIGELFMKNYPQANITTLMVAGEKLQYYQPTTYQVLNGYGPTEFTILSHVASINKEYLNYPIGEPLPGIKCLIDLKEPENQSEGELYLVGSQRALGYLNDYQQTKEKFIKLKNGEIAYKTGDIVRYESGEYRFLARSDRQIKYHGYRIELSEIEAVALKSKMISSAHAISDNSDLILVVIPSEEYTEDEFRNHLKEYLPSYSLPKVIKTVDVFPLTSSGKVDISSLLIKKISNKSSMYYGSLTPTMKKIVKIFKKYTNLKEINVEENYLNLSLDSLDFIQICLEIENKLNGVISFYDFIRYPTIKDLANYLDKKNHTEKIVEIRKGTGVPLVIVFDFSCDIIAYRELLANIDQNIPIIGIVDKGLPSDVSLEKYVESLVLKLESYHSFDLVGYSSGGTIALEIARQVPSKVNNIFLIDTPNYYKYQKQVKKLITLLTKNVFSIVSLYGILEAIRYGINKLKSLTNKKSIFYEQKKLRKMILNYQVKEVNKPITLFKSKALMKKTDSDLGWGNLNVRFKSYRYQANHITIMKKKVIKNICYQIEKRRKENGSTL